MRPYIFSHILLIIKSAVSFLSKHPSLIYLFIRSPSSRSSSYGPDWRSSSTDLFIWFVNVLRSSTGPIFPPIHFSMISNRLYIIFPAFLPSSTEALSPHPFPAYLTDPVYYIYLSSVLQQDHPCLLPSSTRLSPTDCILYLSIFSFLQQNCKIWSGSDSCLHIER